MQDPLPRFDPLTQEPMAIPAWLIADSAGLTAMPFGRATWHEANVGFGWGSDNSAALAAGILTLAPDIGARAAATRFDVTTLAECFVGGGIAGTNAAGETR